MGLVKRVALAGAAGVLGAHIFEALLANGSYTVTILTRTASHHDLGAANSRALVKVVEVDYESLDSLYSALKGQDVLISVLGKTALAYQPRLIDAAVLAHVKRIIPSEFGSDLRNLKSRLFPTYRPKIDVEEQLERHCARSDTSYTFIFNNVLLDWGLTHGLLMSVRDRTIRLFDGGDILFSTTSMATVGRAVVGVLQNYDKTSNRSVYIHDIAITQKELMAMAQEATREDGGKSWVVTTEDTAELEAAAFSDFERGLVSPKVFYGFAVRAAFGDGYGGHFQNVDNDLLGIREMDRNEVRDLVYKIISQDREQGVC